jgi:hypothetical protein
MANRTDAPKVRTSTRHHDLKAPPVPGATLVGMWKQFYLGVTIDECVHLLANFMKLRVGEPSAGEVNPRTLGTD